MPRRRNEEILTYTYTVPNNETTFPLEVIREHLHHIDQHQNVFGCEICGNLRLHEEIMHHRSQFENIHDFSDESLTFAPSPQNTRDLTIEIPLRPHKKAMGGRGYCEYCKMNLDKLVKTARDGLICLSCRKLAFRLCWGCKQLYLQGDFAGHLGKRWCFDCFKQITVVECRECKALFESGDTWDTADSYRVCVSCGQAKYTRCHQCHQFWRKENMFRCEPHDGWFCSSHRHAAGCEGNSNNRRWDDTFQDGKKCVLLNNKRYMGVEIEAEMMPRRDSRGRSIPTKLRQFGLPEAFGITHDRSLRCGKEVNTPPASGIAHVRNVKLACAALKKAGYIILPSCGLHVHIDLRDKVENFIYLAHLLTTFYAIEDLLYAMQPASRQKNHYCKWLRDDFKFFDFYGRKYITDFDYRFYKLNKKRISENELIREKAEKYNHSRYYGVNFHSIFFLGTLEIRIHAGSLKPIKIIRWCEIIQKIVNWVDTSYKYERVLELLALPANEQKLDLFSRIFQLTPALIKHLMARVTQFNNMGLRHRVTLGSLPKIYMNKVNQNNTKIKKILQQIKDNNRNLPSSQVSREQSERSYRDNAEGEPVATVEARI